MLLFFTKIFSFLHRHDEAFSTEPIRSMAQNRFKLTFNHVQELRTQASPAFVYYLQHFPVIFEVFGHLNKTNSTSATLAALSAIDENEKFVFKKLN